jgi:hypothetical protein
MFSTVTGKVNAAPNSSRALCKDGQQLGLVRQLWQKMAARGGETGSVHLVQITAIA